MSKKTRNISMKIAYNVQETHAHIIKDVRYEWCNEASMPIGYEKYSLLGFALVCFDWAMLLIESVNFQP